MLKTIRAPLSFFIVLSLVTPAWSEDPKKNQSPPVTADTQVAASNYEFVWQGETSQTFRRYIDSSATVRQIYRELQWEMINDADDKALTHFYRSYHPFLFKLYQEVEKVHVQSLDAFSIQSQASSFAVRPTYNAAYRHLFLSMVETAGELGASKEAIENLEFYLKPGAMNAFTVSGTDERLVVVAHEDLVKNMTNAQVRAVIAHEIGHTLSGHVVKGYANMFMLNIIGQALTRHMGGEDISLEDFDHDHLEVKLTDSKICTSEMCMKSIHGEGFDLIKQMDAPSRSTFNRNLNALFSQSFQAMAQLDPQDITNIFKTYLEILAQTVTNHKGPPQTAEYFIDLANALPALQTVRVDPEQFSQHAEIAMMAISRSNENSADNYSASETPNFYIVMALSRLGGGVFKREDRQELFKQILASAKRVEERTTPETLHEYVGTSHPSLILRAARLLKESQYPFILFANPFLRLMLLKDGISDRVRTLTDKIAILDRARTRTKTEMELLKNKPADRSYPISAALENAKSIKNLEDRVKRLDRQENAFRDELSELQKATKGLNHDILKLTLELNIEQLRNPRFSNVIEYYAFEREMLLQKQFLLTTELKHYHPDKSLSAEENEVLKAEFDGENAKRNAIIKQEIQNTHSQLVEPNPVLVGLKAKIEKRLAVIQTSTRIQNKKEKIDILNDRLHILDITMNSTNFVVTEGAVSELEGVRRAVRHVSPYRTDDASMKRMYSARIPLKTPLQTTVSACHQALREKSPTPKAQ